MKKTIELIKHNIRGHNKYITDEKLNKMTINELLLHTHPLDRQYFAEKLKLKLYVKPEEL